MSAIEINISCRSIKPHSHERQRLRLRVRLCQIANIASMGCVKCKEEWVLHPFFAFDATSSLTQCYHLDANAHADAHVDARVNGPLLYKNHITSLRIDWS